MIPTRPVAMQRPKQQGPMHVARCQDCRDVGFVMLPGKRLETFGDEEIFSKAVPCSCEAGEVYRIDFAIRGEACDARSCENPAAHGADWGGLVKWCHLHQLEAADAWRAAVEERRGFAEAGLWRKVVRKVLKITETGAGGAD